MNIYIVCVGKIKDKYIIDGISEFKKRMQAFANLEIVELKEFSKEDNIQLSIKKESDELLKTLSKLNSYEILLDLNGKEFDSVAMSNYIENLKTKGVSSISFIIGGSDGVNEELKKKVDLKLKFSNFTFPHQLIRLILMEQIYRWFSISNNIKYHK
ncbi:MULTISPECIES: 23S rRNA (pseudouridine(1915)-N(3))-methyltransferase RlmH [Fusobacterium]|uniref:23S rRNA (pseudouridine(1915)-N(3))-methyltransferase RlmH n=1 Tax=Fusobacterium TaxID=848 RepID=UPI0025B913AD|nr:23S rRNA (pseudouridine(1915)-N(3))-methyltransferase RlmH [Fusobacterium sp.]MCI5725275.1 23S rRNA (pseudouridine(1915)-N(3))-methyltransferase RlmH [Fusobacterium sp.]MCI7223904.1 23S rRNA (pseudouridine(1915)-N(3))-methyltransferase RlmH [Fusobacterium sp.]MDD7409609.1 23S rRNA (pseudouridine(1915)-N(3))-methyltransferase RlmH [Fusobacteriaceae bacterium]MDY5713324.1 23S rRNA (pseudouridine(1915)-N(3))-methyltransferase RlmH [Fusobacterium gastrosuis]